jgi:hypothetical protein
MKPFCASMIGVIALAPQIAQASDFVVPMNQTRRIDFHISINEDCSSRGETVVRVETSPQHGTVSVKLGKDHPNFPQSNPRSACNVRLAPSTEVWYSPQHGYAGPDSVGLDVIYPDGKSLKQTITINVR